MKKGLKASVPFGRDCHERGASVVVGLERS
jgi:hypothetical protein